MKHLLFSHPFRLIIERVPSSIIVTGGFKFSHNNRADKSGWFLSSLLNARRHDEAWSLATFCDIAWLQYRRLTVVTCDVYLPKNTKSCSFVLEVLIYYRWEHNLTISSAYATTWYNLVGSVDIYHCQDKNELQLDMEYFKNVTATSRMAKKYPLLKVIVVKHLLYILFADVLNGTCLCSDVLAENQYLCNSV